MKYLQRLVLVLGALAVLALSLGGVRPGPALAATITVNTAVDELNADGDCSLREAVRAANLNAAVDSCTAGSGTDTINLPAGPYNLIIPGASEDASATGDLDIAGDVTITGAGAATTIIDGGDLDRVFHVTGNFAVNISGVTVRNGFAADGGGIYNFGGTLTLGNVSVLENNGDYGGGILNETLATSNLTLNSSTVSGNVVLYTGGGISNGGNATLNSSIISNNISSDLSGVFGGGGIYNLVGGVTLNGSAVSGNTAASGGGIRNDYGAATLNSSVVSGNTADNGGGIFNYDSSGSIVLNNSAISDNDASSYGGGIFLNDGTLILDRSTISDNFAGFRAAGIFLSSSPSTTLTSSTVSGNVAVSDGGGILNVNGSALTIVSSTISGNLASSGGGISNSATLTLISSTISGNVANSGGGISNSDPAFFIKNTIVANSSSGGNCSGVVPVSYGFNLSSDGTCALAAIGDRNDTNPLLGPLASNGGPTRTHALLAGSPAVEGGLLTTDPACSGGNDFDQRGVARPQGPRCDIGAYEANDSDGDGAPDPLDLDDDNDTVPDALDSCPLVAEDIDGHQDEGGCPDADNDGDGICDPGLLSVACTGSDVGRYLWKNPLGGAVDCRNVAEDIDNFHDNDGCPEPDNDYDTFQDFTDDCPAADTNVGADGVADTGDEPTFYLTPYQSREDFDGVIDWDGCHDSPNDDYDGDGAGDETEVFTLLTDPVNPDTDADTVVDGSDNCPNWSNTPQNLPTWTIPANDSDCDGFTVAREQWTGTDPTRHCNADSTTNNEATDAWPSDFNDSRLTSLADVVLMGPFYNQSTGTDPAKKRFDLNASGLVSLADVVLMGPFYNKSCA